MKIERNVFKKANTQKFMFQSLKLIIILEKRMKYINGLFL